MARLDLRRLPVPARKGGATLAVFLVASFALIMMMKRTISPYDEAIILVGAKQVQVGAVPYRDFYANYGPANFYVLAGMFKIFGSSILVERAWDTAVRAATVMCSFQLARIAVSRSLAWIAAGLMAIWLGSIGSYSYPIYPSLLCCLVGLLCIARVGRDGSSCIAAAGIAAGLCALFRFDVGVYGIIVLAASASARLGWRRAIGPFLAGVAVVGLPALAAFAIEGALGDLLFDNLVFPARSYAAMRSLPFPPLADLMADPYQAAVYVPVLVSALSASAALIGWGRHPVIEMDRARWLVLSLAAMSATFYLKGLVRVSVIHMALSLLPSMLLGIASLGLVRGGFTAVRVLVGASLAIAAVPTVAAVGQDIDAVQATYAWATSPATWREPTSLSSCVPPPSLSRLRCFTVDPTWSKMVTEVETHSRADQPIFVGLAHHDRVFVNDVLIYFAVQRRPATKWYQFDPGLQTTARIQSSIIDDIDNSRPAIAVLDDTWSSVREPNESSLSSGVSIIDQYLSYRFRSVKILGPYDLRVPKVD